VATSEPVVLHHGREPGPSNKRRRAAVSFNSRLGSEPPRARTPEKRDVARSAATAATKDQPEDGSFRQAVGRPTPENGDDGVAGHLPTGGADATNSAAAAAFPEAKVVDPTGLPATKARAKSERYDTAVNSKAAALAEHARADERAHSRDRMLKLGRQPYAPGRQISIATRL
jgi:hypothetical protein